MKKSISGALNFFAGALLTLFVLGQLAFVNNENKRTSVENKWQPPALPEELSFSGETVPLNRWDVKERLDREVSFNFYGQANILFLLKLSNRYFPVISERLKANGVPDDFKYLCVAESNLIPNAISSAGAVSFWQFLKGTAPGYSLTVNSEVDERYDVEKATDAACKYFKQAYAKFGSWTAAAASYNCGQGGYSRQAGFQKTTNYYDLLLPEETNRYIFRILAFKHLLENAEKLGFVLKEEDKYVQVPSRIVQVSSTIPDLAQFALANGSTYKVLKLMNPWLRGKSLTIKSGKTYDIKFPVQ